MTDPRQEASDILHAYASHGYKPHELCEIIGIPPDYLAMARTMRLNEWGKPRCPMVIIQRILDFVKHGQDGYSKVDDNQAEIIAAFRKLGYSVEPTHIIGKGFPDAVAGKWGFNYLLEIKDGAKSPSRRRLTDDEAVFHGEWRGSIHIIESLSDVIEFDRKHSRRHG